MLRPQKGFKYISPILFHWITLKTKPNSNGERHNIHRRIIYESREDHSIIIDRFYIDNFRKFTTRTEFIGDIGWRNPTDYPSHNPGLDSKIDHIKAYNVWNIGFEIFDEWTHTPVLSSQGPHELVYFEDKDTLFIDGKGIIQRYWPLGLD